MSTEIFLIAMLILLLISIVLNIFTYFKIEKEKNLILKELSAQISVSSQQIQKDLKDLKEETTNQKKEIYDVDRKIDESNRKIEYIIKLLKEPLTEEDLRWMIKNIS